ncbi:MAG: DMT family transporter [Alphaproteobacteria bacterium]|nr:DMT family transporter [Alphaproteobacteria bacterium]
MTQPPDVFPSPPTPLAPAGDAARAIGLMIVAVLLFSCLDAAAKYLTTRGGVPVAQVIWVRFIVQFVLLMVMVPALGVLSLKSMFRTKKLGWQLVRSAMMALTTAFNFLALQYLRLDQTITIMFLTPLIVALAAGPLLGEWVGMRRLVAILVGFAGILIVVRPGLAAVHPAILLSFASMAAYVAFALITRHIASFDPPLVTLFFSMFAGVLLGFPFAAATWQWDFGAPVWALLLTLGILGGAGHYLFILAYRLAPAGIITPFIYLQIVSMSALGYVIFGDIPDIWTAIGSTVIVASGIYLFYREQAVKGGA